MALPAATLLSSLCCPQLDRRIQASAHHRALHFCQGRDPLDGSLHAVPQKSDEPIFSQVLGDDRRPFTFQDHFLHRLVHRKSFDDGGAALEPGAAAGVTPPPVRKFRRTQTDLPEKLFLLGARL